MTSDCDNRASIPDTQPRVLIIDDEAHILHVLSLKLSNAGYQVITAEDGEEAFDAAVRYTPAVIITDYQMPFINGLTLCEKLKANPSTSQTPCIMLTARGYSLTAEQIAATNIAAVMTKPFSPREILQRVDALSGRSAVVATEGASEMGS